MYANNPYSNYKKNSIAAVTQEQLLLMLVDGAVKYTKIARLALIENNIPRAHKELVRVQDIFFELMVTMDKSAGTYMEDLYNIYEFIKNELALANVNKDVKKVEEVLPLIEEIRDMWYEVDKKVKGIS